MHPMVVTYDIVSKTELSFWTYFDRRRWIYFLIIVVVLFVGSSSSDQDVNCGEQGVDCYHGTCRNVTGAVRCVCDQGWGGSACQHCSGRQSLTATSGYLTDGHGNYSADNKCTWLIQPSSSARPIRLRFQHFSTECSWDHLYIYDGDSVWNMTLAVLSGLIIPIRRSNQSIPEITATSGSAYVHFYSDIAYNMTGFNITYIVGSCPLECSGHGDCLPDDTCNCDALWTGPGCEISMCPNNCTQGECTGLPDGYCRCQNGWRGIDCSIPDYRGVWTEKRPLPSDNIPHPRTSHASVIQKDSNMNHLWILLGYDFGKPGFQDVVKIDLEMNLWLETLVKSSVSPARRYGHSAALYQDKIYMFGGLIGTHITDELWTFDVVSQHWLLIDDATVTPRSAFNSTLAVVGHTAHIVDDVMYVIFGHSPLYGFCNYIQMYNITSNTWEVTHGGGAVVKGGYGHSSVYHEETGSIYVHAGYYHTVADKYTLTDNTYAFDVANQSWTILLSSGHYKYLHSAVIINDLMLVFGGNIHNGTADNQGSKCYSSHFLVYDIACDTWHTLDSPHLTRDISRFGQTADVLGDKMYVFGGFDGLVLNDVFVYTPGVCSSITDRETCLSSREGVICAWVNENQCLPANDALQKYNIKLLERVHNSRCTPRPPQDDSLMCGAYDTCPGCVENSYHCAWCNDHCLAAQDCAQRQHASDLEQCDALFPEHSTVCPTLNTCHACLHNKDCCWSQSSTNKCQSRLALSSDDAESCPAGDSLVCDPPCQHYTACSNCTSKKCMWCVSEERCVDTNSYVPSFPYGQCMEWTMITEKCPMMECEGLLTCSSCHDNPQCGWCDDETQTGLGRCMAGSSTAPRHRNTCPDNRWYFTKCPLCQCNGHSKCIPGTSVCERCRHPTTGPQCQFCQEGYWGDPRGGATCKPCACGQAADTCDRDNGNCYCHTYGMMGKFCDSCNESRNSYGDPANGGTCFFNLTVGFKYQYNISDDNERKYYTRVNFMMYPTSSNVDVDFLINCTGEAKVNVSVQEGTTETFLFVNMPCVHHNSAFSHKTFNFGTGTNTTINVYIFDFRTPFHVLISFSQFSHINLVQFFVTFFSCFLSLLLIAAIFWKIKQKYDLYRRRQRLVVEMEQMASRPFSCIHLEIDDFKQVVPSVPQPQNPRASSRHRNPANNTRSTAASPVSLEPLVSQKAAVLSLMFRMPCGDEDYTPAGQPGLAVGSTLVALGSGRKSSGEHCRLERATKSRKSKNTDNCA